MLVALFECCLVGVDFLVVGCLFICALCAFGCGFMRVLAGCRFIGLVCCGWVCSYRFGRLAADFLVCLGFAVAFCGASCFCVCCY